RQHNLHPPHIPDDRQQPEGSGGLSGQFTSRLAVAFMIRRYARGRLLQLLIVLWGAATVNFLIPRLAPGNPIRERLYTLSNSGGINQAAIEEMVRAYDKDFGFDQPLLVQYVRYLWNISHLDCGYS